MRRLVNECLRLCAVQRFSRYNHYSFGRYLALGVVSPYFQHYELMLVSTALTYSVVLRMPLKTCSCNPYALVS